MKCYLDSNIFFGIKLKSFIKSHFYFLKCENLKNKILEILTRSAAHQCCLPQLQIFSLSPLTASPPDFQPFLCSLCIMQL